MSGKIIKFPLDHKKDNGNDGTLSPVTGRILNFNPGIYDPEALNNPNPDGTYKRAGERISQDIAMDDGYDEALRISREPGQARFRKGEITKKAKTIGETAILFAGIIAAAAAIAKTEKKWPEFPQPTMTKSGTEDVGIDDMKKEEVNKSIQHYQSIVAEILSDTKKDFTSLDDKTIDEIRKYLIDSAKDEYTFRLAVFALYGQTGLGGFPIAMNNVLPLKTNEDSNITPLAMSDGLSEYLDKIGCTSYSKYSQDELQWLYREYLLNGLTDTEKLVLLSVLDNEASNPEYFGHGGRK